MNIKRSIPNYNILKKPKSSTKLTDKTNFKKGYKNKSKNKKI